MSGMTRRKLIATGVTATAGLAGLGAAARIAERWGLLPPDSGGLYGLGGSLTYASQRLITRHSMAREFSRGQISAAPFANGRAPRDQQYVQLQRDGFADWRLQVDGMVAQPASFSIAELRSHPQRTQITHLACEEGWSFIAEWTGVPLSHLLRLVGALPQARYPDPVAINKRS